MADLKTQNKAHSHEERGNDLYETPPEAVRALLGVETLPRTIWEPACGPGAIARTLREEGHQVLATDLVDYHSEDQDYGGLDFLLAGRMAVDPGTGRPYEAIVTNPPYKHAQAFVTRALELCPRVYMLLRLAFLESERRRDILDDGRLARVHVFRDRLPMMHRHGWQGNKTGSAIAFAWFCWDTRQRGSANLHRVSWRDFK